MCSDRLCVLYGSSKLRVVLGKLLFEVIHQGTAVGHSLLLAHAQHGVRTIEGSNIYLQSVYELGVWFMFDILSKRWSLLSKALTA